MLAVKAWTARKSRCSAPGGTEQVCHRYPPSSVRRMVPFVPEAQATPPPAEEIPRRSAVLFEFRICHWADAGMHARMTARRGRRAMAAVYGKKRWLKRLRERVEEK